MEPFLEKPFSDCLPEIADLLKGIGFHGFSIESLQHGPVFQNCVYALGSEDGQEQYVLRVPVKPKFRESDQICEAILNEVSLLGYLMDNLSVPTPRVKAYSATTGNALQAPFSIQTRLPVADQVIEMLGKLESVRFDIAGNFAGSSALPHSNNSFCAADSSPPMVNMFNEGDEDFAKDPKCLQDRAGPDVKALLISQLSGLLAKELKSNTLHRVVLVPLLRRLVAMMEGLYPSGSQGEGPYPIILFHWDLEPRNIMVRQSGDTWQICGIVDWDDAMAVPRPLARRPLAWIWSVGTGVRTGFLDDDTHPKANLSEDNTALKAHFDDKAAVALPSYTDDTYGQGRWLRRIWTFLKYGVHSQWHCDQMEEMLKEWDTRPRPA